MGALLFGDNAVSWPMYFQGHSGRAGDDDVWGSFESQTRTSGKYTQLPVDDFIMKGIYLPLARAYDHPRLHKANDLHRRDSFSIATGQHIHLHQHIGMHLISKVPPKSCLTCVSVCVFSTLLHVYTSPKKTSKQEKRKNMQQKYLRLEACSLKIHRVFLWADLGLRKKGGKKRKEKIQKRLLAKTEKKEYQKKKRRKSKKDKSARVHGCLLFCCCCFFL